MHLSRAAYASLTRLSSVILSYSLLLSLGAPFHIRASAPAAGSGKDSFAATSGHPAGQRTAHRNSELKDAPQDSSSSGGSLVAGADGQGERRSVRAPLRGRPSSNLPDLDVTRRHRPTRPKAPEPIRSTRRNCPPRNPRCNDDVRGASSSTPTPVRPTSADQPMRYVQVAAMNIGTQDGGHLNSVPTFGSGRNGLSYSTSDSPFGLSWVARALNDSGSTSVFPAMISTAASAWQSDAAAFVSQSVPSPMIAGQTYHVWITMRNTGTTTWSPENSYRLGSENTRDNIKWRLNRVQLPAIVPPGAEVTIDFDVTAPLDAATHNFQWRIVQDGPAGWFGEPTTNIPVSVLTPQYNGALEFSSCDYISGWAGDSTRPNTPIQVDIFADNNFVARTVADQFHRSSTKGASAYNGYIIQTPTSLFDSRAHKITVRVANTLFTSNGSPYLAGSTKGVTCAPRPAATPNNIMNAVPGIIQAEDFDQGANGDAYYDASPGNYGGVYRTTDVDIEGCPDGSCGFWLNWVHDTEWTKYTINVATTGTYTIETMVASTRNDGSGLDGSFRIEIDGVNVTGAITVADTGGMWQARPKAGIQLTAGQHVMKVIGNMAGGTSSTGWAGKLDRFKFTRSGDPAGARTPYSGVAAVVPGTVQAEDFDRGTNGVAYYDATPGNYGMVYRTGSDDWVDIEGCLDASCGYWLAWVHNGEWTEYTINVAAEGDYNLSAVVASMSTYADGKFRIEIDGVDRTGTNGLEVPNTTATGWQTTQAVQLHLTAGQHVMRVVGLAGAVTGWAGKLDRIVFTNANDTTGNSFSQARLKESNRTGGGGVDLLSGNFNWGLPLVSLAGRSGLDLGLTLSYNSLVWTKDGNAIEFNSDNGYPAPGFRLGFPTIQQRYTNAQTNRFAYLMITPSGSRVELHQVGNSNVYESADSSYLQLIDYGGSMLLRATDGTQLSFRQLGGEFQCTQVKDRNGNFITIEYDSQGGLSTVKDTLARVISFDYDQYHNLLSITQDWNGQPHMWATFGYATKEFISPFTNPITVLGPQNHGLVSVLAQVGLADGSSYRFDYTSALQVSAIRRYSADNHQLAYTAYTLPTSSDDCPRVSARRDWALDWNNGDEAVTNYLRAADGSWGRTITPDGTLYEEVFATSGWQKGLTTQTEILIAGTMQKRTVTDWTQDDVSLNYRLNPRPAEIHIYDQEGNHKRTGITYTTYGLPFEIKEYAADGQTVLRRTETYYRLDSTYIDRRLIGLSSQRLVYDGAGALVSKTAYDFDRPDWNGFMQPTAQPPVQHDAANYGSNFVYGRGNLVYVGRFDVADPDNWSKVTAVTTGYNQTGAPIFTRDALLHRTNIDYKDSFSKTGQPVTYAYPTAITDPDEVARQVLNPQQSLAEYNYDTGAVTSTVGVSPDTMRFEKGAVQVLAYDAAGRLERATNTTSGMYTRHVYAPGQNWVQTFSTVRDSQTESYSIQILDGAGRVYAAAADLPGSVGKYSGQHTVYDVMGRAVRASNPTEINNGWEPAGDDSEGWRYSTQDYDWKGRPTYSTHADGGMNQELIYGGCGCAGGEVVTIRDAMGRRRRMTSDVLGRPWKAEVFDSNGNVYSTTTNTYNARDQLTSVEEREGTNGTAQQTLMTYDGHGRLSKQHMPQQDAGKDTVYTYDADDTVATVTDARLAKATYSYNKRHQVTGIVYDNSQAGTMDKPVDPAATVTFGYDAAGNRTWMDDGVGRVNYQYDQLSRLTSETRQFDGAGSFPLYYSYTPGGQVASVTDWQGTQVNYTYDQIGRLSNVTTPTPYEGNVQTYASNMEYRAWGALKRMTYGNGRVLAQVYDARLQLSHFEIGGW
ncbi:MAG TPA: carbohydrate-binding protein, partial [Pyrinomonadaceae bacterium]|nr:carbohydrate-binding protein [Pyrinomonadaceae bacterium]